MRGYVFFAEKLGGHVLESTCRGHDCDVEPVGSGLPRVASECKPSREDIAEAILSVGLNRGVGCDMVPRILELLFAKISAQTLLPHAWRGCLEVTVPKSKGSAEKRSVGLVNHTAKMFFNALRQRLNPVLGEAALPTQMGGLRARGADRSCALFVYVVCGLLQPAARTGIRILWVSREPCGESGEVAGACNLLPGVGVTCYGGRHLFCVGRCQSSSRGIGSGSIPGHILADLAFNFVMLDALQEVTGRLRGEGLIDSVEWYPDAGPSGAPCGQSEQLEVLPIALMDDIRAFSSHASVEQAARELAKTAELYFQVLERQQPRWL